MQAIRELRTLEEPLDLLDEWITAYGVLRREHLRLQLRCDDAEFWAEQHEFMRRHLDPFLPDNMQDAKARAAEPALYAAIASLRDEKPRHSRFEEMALDEADPFG